MIYKFRIKPELMWRPGRTYTTDNLRDLWDLINYIIERSLKEFFEYRPISPSTKYNMERMIEMSIERCIQEYVGSRSGHFGELDWFVRLVESWYPRSFPTYGGCKDLVIFKPQELKVIVNSLMVAKYIQKLL